MVKTGDKKMSGYLTIGLLMGFIGLGLLIKIVLGKIKLIDKAIHLFSKFLYFILLPLVFFDTFAKRGLVVADASIFTIAIIYVFVSVLALMKIPINSDHRIRNAMIITSIFQNNVFLGFPVLLILFNDIGAAATYSLVIFILHISTAGLLAASEENILISVAKIPIIYGFLGGTAVHYLLPSIYPVLEPLLEPTHQLLSYGAVFVLGYTLPLTLRHVFIHKKCFAIITLWRFLVSPVMHYLMIILLPMPTLYKMEIMVLSFMPPAVMNTVIARIYGWEPEFVASSTLVLTLISLGVILFIPLVL